MKAIIPLYIANVKEFSRDRIALFWTFAFPIAFIFLFGLIFSGTDNTTNFDVGLVIEDQGAVAKGLAQTFQSVGAFNITQGSQEEMLARLKKGDLRAVVVIPQGLSGAAAAGQPTKLDVYYDPSNQTTAQVVLTIIEKVVDSFDQQITRRPAMVSIAPKSVIASNLRSIDFLLPGIIGMSLMQLGLFATANVLVELREKQVLRRLGATPLSRTNLLTSQVLFRLTIGLIQTLSIILVGIVFFHVHIQSSLLVLMGIVLLGALMFVALGYLISGLARTQDSVSAITSLVQFPMLFLSGIFFPIEIMPQWIRPVVNLIPLSYLADLLRQVMVGATPAFPLAVDLIVVFAWLLICSIFAVKFFRWE
jgi:ABC-2 type transport system permease protein